MQLSTLNRDLVHFAISRLDRPFTALPPRIIGAERTNRLAVAERLKLPLNSPVVSADPGALKSNRPLAGGFSSSRGLLAVNSSARQA